MGVPINNVPRRVVFAVSGTGPYAFTFEILAAGDIAVFRDDALLTLTTDYTVLINPDGTGSVTLTATPTGATQIAIVGNRTIQRISDFVTGGDFFANTLNDELDQQTIFAQQNAEGLARSLQAPITDPTNVDMTLPRLSERAGKYLVFDSSGNPAPGEIPEVVNTVANNIESINAVNANSSNINTVAGQISPNNNVATVAGISAAVSTVAGISSAVSAVSANNSNVTTVATNVANVNTVASGISNVNAVANNSVNIVTVASNTANIDAVAGNETNINEVATNITDVQAIGPIAGGLGDIISNIQPITDVANDLTGDNTIGAVATNLGAVQIVGSDLGGSGFDYDLGSITVPATGPSNTPDGFIQTVVNNLQDITDVADDINAANTIGTVATNIANVNAVGINISNVNAVAGNATNINAVAGNATNINSVVSNSTNINVVATNIASVNTVAGISADVSVVAGDSSDIQLLAANIGTIAAKANAGANSDITSLSGLTTALSVAQGGTGATTAEGARTGLGLGALAVKNTVDTSDIDDNAVTVGKLATTLDLGGIV